MASFEINLDGLVGPTHNYSGLSYGNVASVRSQKETSNPKQAALQGLLKMKYLMDLGIKQAVMPPQERPHLATLRQLGFKGSDQEILKKAYSQAPDLFFSCCSASSMWTANAATVCPSADSTDGLVHITPANLFSKLHRSIEPATTTKLLQRIFNDEKYFLHHSPLGPGAALADEGAANHTRFGTNTGASGIQLFVFGRYALERSNVLQPVRFPARQTFEASQAIARNHKIPPERVIFAQQNPKAIDAGVFHNDVISVGHQNLFLYHELAFLNTDQVIKELQLKMQTFSNQEMILVPVSNAEISLEDAVKSYLFNSQIVTLPNGKFVLLAPTECQEMPSVHSFLEKMARNQKNVIEKVHFFNLYESMRNGGGPACLRLRIALNEKELAAAHQEVFLTPKLYDALVAWVNKHYRDYLTPNDLQDYSLLEEGRQALDELTNLLNLGSIYAFQK